MPPFHHTGPKDPMKSKRQSLSQNNRTSHFIEEKPQAQEKYSINPLKGKDSNKGISLLCQDQDVSTHTLDQGPSSSPAGGSRMAHSDETRSNDANKRPHHWETNSPESHGMWRELQRRAQNINLFRVVCKGQKHSLLPAPGPPWVWDCLALGRSLGTRNPHSTEQKRGIKTGWPSKLLPL